MNHTTHLDDRTQKQKQRLRDKLNQRHKEPTFYPTNHAPSSPHRVTKGKTMNGSIDLRRQDPSHSSSSSADGQELEDERRTIRKYLSKMTTPKVSEVESRSALIQLTPPECNQNEFEIDPAEFKYELLLSDKGREGKYKLVYNGDATEITLKDLRPATEYHLKVSSLLDDLHGELTDPVSFRTMSCEPDPPSAPKLSSRTKTSLLLKWNTTSDNGAKISSYSLEYDQGRGDMEFVEVYNGLQRQFKVTKLSASTGYTFRLASVNAVGKSQFSDAVCYYTSGSVPSQPDPPMLSEQFVKALTISWIKRPNDDAFTLQMEDEATGHGFLTVYNGPDLSYKIKNLRRNTEYKYRLSGNNEEGSSKWSDVVNYRTLPDRPAVPPRPAVKGKIHAATFRISWDGPRDTGGSEITKYHLEMDDGRGYELVYEGSEKETTCDHLLPGHTYRCRIACTCTGGQSDWSEPVTVTTLAVAPGVCQTPKLQGKPKATSLHLKWNYPDYDGGAPVTDFEVQMSLPDNSTQEVYRGRELDCTVAGLSPGRPYLFQVRAVNKMGESPWSDSLEVVSGPGVPDPPKLPMVHCKSPHSIVINWEEPVNNGATITEYRLECQSKADGEFTQLYFGSALTYEVRGLAPATLYSFRVQAQNSAGVGPFSAIASCLTPPSSPGPVVSLRATATANTITLMWKEPLNNGSDIISFNIDLGEKHQISVSNVLEYVIHDLLPETTYKIRVQAVNSIGVGAFSSAVKVTTRPLPPQPPRLECLSCTHNSLKLKWGEGKNPDLVQYVLEMMRDNGSFHPVYHGPSHTHKVNKLSELTEYEFRIYASNDAGDGPYSDVIKFITTKAPPPAVKMPKSVEVHLDSCLIEWPACRQMGQDTLTYNLQLQCPTAKDTEYKSVYRGEETSYKLEGLSAKTEYLVRVCAVRQYCDGSGELLGAFSPPLSLTTTSPKPVMANSNNTVSTTGSSRSESKSLSDQQWAMILLLGFTLCAILFAVLAQQIIAYSNSGGSGSNNTN
jgi:predicted phage tail protein